MGAPSAPALTPTPLTDPLPSNPSSFINPGLLPMSWLLLQKDDSSGRGESKGDSLSNQEVTVNRRGPPSLPSSLCPAASGSANPQEPAGVVGLRLASNQEQTAIHNCSPQLGQNGMVCKSQREEVSSQARNYSIRVSPLCFDGENRPGWEMGEELRSGVGGTPEDVVPLDPQLVLWKWTSATSQGHREPEAV